MRFFEDIHVGDREVFGRYTFSGEDIRTFAARFDPQPFHLDDEAAAATHFGRLCASGWHTAVMCMRCLVDHRRADADARRARGEEVARTGVSPGFRDLKWLKPVFPGDTVTYGSEVIALRPLQTRPEWGLMTSRHSGTNQHGELVISFESSVFVERRRVFDEG
jgi:acyl dehydratase